MFLSLKRWWNSQRKVLMILLCMGAEVFRSDSEFLFKGVTEVWAVAKAGHCGDLFNRFSASA
jgi:hypothetical protein